MFKPNLLPVNTGWAFVAPDNRNPFASRGGFQPINIDAIPGLTLHMRADVGFTASANRVVSILNTAPTKLRLSSSTLRTPFTSTSAFGIPAPYFSGAVNDAKFLSDIAAGGTALSLTGVVSPQRNQFHCFAVWNVESKGADIADATGYTARSLAGSTGGWFAPVTFQNTGLKAMAFDSANRVTAFISYQTATNYISETSLGALAPLSLSFSLNGGTAVTASMAAIIGGNDEFGVGSGQLMAATTTMQGQIAELIFFSRSLDAATATQIRLTLGQRWGITTL